MAAAYIHSHSSGCEEADDFHEDDDELGRRDVESSRCDYLAIKWCVWQVLHAECGGEG